MTSVIAIMGRPNVGKSTLFNRLSRSRHALVDDQPGITRDRLYANTTWRGVNVTIIDTGGFEDAEEGPFSSRVREQVIRALDESDRILFMVDGLQGVMPGDKDLVKILRHRKKKFFLVANKIDGPEHDHLMSDFYQLGIPRVYPLSAAHGYGLRALMDEIISDLPKGKAHLEKDDQIRVAILGRPNVGKSSLINRILGFDRLLVSDLPGTTRDTVDTTLTWRGKTYLFIDTAGIRRKSRVKEKIEKFSMIKAVKSLSRCHIAVILLDAEAGIAEQDARICGYAFEQGRGVLLAVNKWDLVKTYPDKKRHIDDAIDRQLKFALFAPLLHISALTGERVKKLFEKIDLLYGQFSTRIGTGEVNRAFAEIMRENPPPFSGRKRLKLFYATQTGTKPPTFVVFMNAPDMVHFSYKRYLINQIRQRFDLQHTPVEIHFRKKGRP